MRKKRIDVEAVILLTAFTVGQLSGAIYRRFGLKYYLTKPAKIGCLLLIMAISEDAALNVGAKYVTFRNIVIDAYNKNFKTKEVCDGEN